MTDVQELKERGLQVSCTNLSCGYYEPHTDHEFTIKKDLMNCLSLVEHIIENCTDTYPHQAEIPGRRRGIYDEFDEATDEIFALLDHGSYGVRKTSIICTTPFSHNWAWKTIREYIQNITT